MSILPLGGAVEFVDLDLLPTGPVVDEVSALFDQFWNSASAYAADVILGSLSPQGAADELQVAFASTPR